MPRLFGRDLPRREFELVTLADGAERSVRALLFRTGGGLEFPVREERPSGGPYLMSLPRVR